MSAPRTGSDSKTNGTTASLCVCMLVRSLHGRIIRYEKTAAARPVFRSFEAHSRTTQRQIGRVRPKKEKQGFSLSNAEPGMARLVPERSRTAPRRDRFARPQVGSSRYSTGMCCMKMSTKMDCCCAFGAGIIRPRRLLFKATLQHLIDLAGICLATSLFHYLANEEP